MKKTAVVVALFMLALPCVALGQGKPTQPPKPGPEAQKLAQWLGRWKCALENPAGEMTMTCAWEAGGFFMVCGSVIGQTELTTVRGYHADEKAYWSFRYFNHGGADFSRGWLHGETWAFVHEDEHRGGKALRRQLTQTFQSPTEWTLQFQYSTEGAPWVTNQVGKCTRAGAGSQ